MGIPPELDEEELLDELDELDELDDDEDEELDVDELDELEDEELELLELVGAVVPPQPTSVAIISAKAEWIHREPVPEWMGTWRF